MMKQNNGWKSEMDLIYDKYLEDSNRVYEKDGTVFYKLVKKEKLRVGGGMVVITVPREAVHTINDCYYDENGTRIFIDFPMHFKFRGEIPRWYMETVVFPIKGVSEVSEIGDYLGMTKGI